MKLRAMFFIWVLVVLLQLADSYNLNQWKANWLDRMKDEQSLSNEHEDILKDVSNVKIGPRISIRSPRIKFNPNEEDDPNNISAVDYYRRAMFNKYYFGLKK
nr:uncharacterized protein LOC121114847 [Lepeophtheirus salmonis]